MSIDSSGQLNLIAATQVFKEQKSWVKEINRLILNKEWLFDKIVLLIVNYLEKWSPGVVFLLPSRFCFLFFVGFYVCKILLLLLFVCLIFCCCCCCWVLIVFIFVYWPFHRNLQLKKILAIIVIFSQTWRSDFITHPDRIPVEKLLYRKGFKWLSFHSPHWYFGKSIAINNVICLSQ